MNQLSIIRSFEQFVALGDAGYVAKERRVEGTRR